MDNVLDTLFYPYEQGALPYPEPGEAVLFLNAAWHEALDSFKPMRLHLQQYFKPFAATLQERGFSVSSAASMPPDTYSTVLVQLPKNIIEARGLLAQGLKALKPGGRILCAGDNKAGGTRIAGILKDFGVTDMQSVSKNKARLCMAARGEVGQKYDEAALEGAIKTLALQLIPDGRFLSMPGIFGWDKIDHGSEILTKYLPDGLAGKGADFGCGYGFLAQFVLEHRTGVTELACIDADFRAVTAAQENLKQYATPKRFFWEDLTKPLTGLFGLDFIVMNPPFHEGKKTDSGIGRAFIDTAAQSLRPDGNLWMVANVQLPYEEMLAAHFQTVKKPFEGEGFKIFHAQK